MSAFSDMLDDDVADVFLNLDEFGVAVTRYPAGVISSGEAVNAVFIEDEEDEPKRDSSRGAEVVRKGKLSIASAQMVTVEDTWLIIGELWQTLALPSAELGMRTLPLQRNDK